MSRPAPMEPRPVAHLRAVERDCGRDVWRRYDRLLDDVRAGGTTWPAWVHAPMAAAYAIVSGGGDRRVPSERVPDVSRLAALAAWRTTKGIYRYDPDLLEALWTTPLDGALPTELLTRLPEWCAYIELGGRRVGDDQMHADVHGCYVHLEHDAADGHSELRLLLDLVDGGVGLLGATGARQVVELAPVPLHLVDGGTLADSARASALRARAEAVAAGVPDLYARAMEQRAAESYLRLAPLVSLVLYLCTEEPDIAADDDPERRPKRPEGRATGAQRVTTWATGARIGAALRRARERGDGLGEGGERAAPIGHVRRAHWHTYWVGSERRGDRRRQLRWLSPMLVGLREEQELVAVVRPVDAEADEELSEHQIAMLERLASAGDVGVERPGTELFDRFGPGGWMQVMRALERRGLARYDQGAAMVRAPGWRITPAGAAALVARRNDKTPAPPEGETGVEVE